jgi:cell division protein FtsQ
VKRPERPAQPAARPTPPHAPTVRPTPRREERPAGTPVETTRSPAPAKTSRQGREAGLPSTRAPLSASRSDASARRAARLRQRYEKAEVRRFTRRARRRRLGWLSALGVLGLIGVLVVGAVFSPILALREIRIDGATRLDPTVLADAVSGQLGTPLALIDEGRLRDELGEFTAIRSYATELVPPGTLVIHIVERSPLGLVATATGFDVVDAAGVVLESAAARPTGLPLLQLDSDGVEGRGFASMAEVLVALPPGVLAQVDAITARTRDDVTLTLAGTSQRVVWGSAADSERKATVLAALLGLYAAGGPGEYDVSAPGIAVFRAD